MKYALYIFTAMILGVAAGGMGLTGFNTASAQIYVPQNKTINNSKDGGSYYEDMLRSGYYDSDENQEDVEGVVEKAKESFNASTRQILGECTPAERQRLAEYRENFKVFSERDTVKGPADVKRAEQMVDDGSIENMVALRIKCDLIQ